MQISCRVRNQGLHRLQIFLKLSGTLIPGFFAWRSFGIGPVAIGEFGRNVVCGTRKTQDIPLRNSQVFQ